MSESTLKGVAAHRVQPEARHDWLRKLTVVYLPGTPDLVVDDFAANLLHHFERNDHTVQEKPGDETDLILTSATFGEAVPWRQALLFTARRRYKLAQAPTICAIVRITPSQFHKALAHFEAVLAKDHPSPEDYDFAGMAPTSHLILYDQGRRGGPIMALARLLQAQAKSIRIILLVAEDSPIEAYSFDLVGAFPRTTADDEEKFYDDLMTRLTVALSTSEVTEHRTVGEPLLEKEWERLSTPSAMRRAGREFGERDFFTKMLRIKDLVYVPALNQAIADQYSEGCYATWDPTIQALVTTATGSDSPVNKSNISEDDLALVVGARSDRQGAVIRQVKNLVNRKPSSEALEMFLMDMDLPQIALTGQWLDYQGISDVKVPVSRSKLHGHRGVSVYDPTRVEYIPLKASYLHYPVSCATLAQAEAVSEAFSRAEALRDPDDPRQVVFTILPGHGVVIVEKWVVGKEPFEVLWQYMDAGLLQIDPQIPQAMFTYEERSDGMHEVNKNDLVAFPLSSVVLPDRI